MLAYEVKFEFEGSTSTVFVIAADVVDAWRQVENEYPGSEVVSLSKRGTAILPSQTEEGRDK